jgi:hypothetical protein
VFVSTLAAQLSLHTTKVSEVGSLLLLAQHTVCSVTLLVKDGLSAASVSAPQPPWKPIKSCHPCSQSPFPLTTSRPLSAGPLSRSAAQASSRRWSRRTVTCSGRGPPSMGSRSQRPAA